MEDFATGLFFFCIYFSFACWLITPSESSAVVANATPLETQVPAATAPTMADYRRAFDVEPESDLEAEGQEPRGAEKLEVINLEKIGIREARKIAGRLGIQQKVNGKDQLLGWLRKQIQKRFEEEPQTTTVIVQQVLSAA